MRKLVSVCVLAGFLIGAQAAHAFIFWSAYDSAKSKIGRAALDGTEVNPELVNGIYFGQGVATDGNHVYWGESGSNPKLAQVGRANPDGSSPNHEFQTGATYCGIFDIVATASELFWLKSDCSGLEYGWDIDRASNVGGRASTTRSARAAISAASTSTPTTSTGPKNITSRAPRCRGPPPPIAHGSMSAR